MIENTENTTQITTNQAFEYGDDGGLLGTTALQADPENPGQFFERVNSTLIAPPMPINNLVPCFDAKNNKWNLVEDLRGKTFYLPDGSEIEIKKLNQAIPDEASKYKPLNSSDKFNLAQSALERIISEVLQKNQAQLPLDIGDDDLKLVQMLKANPTNQKLLDAVDLLKADLDADNLKLDEFLTLVEDNYANNLFLQTALKTKKNKLLKKIGANTELAWQDILEFSNYAENLIKDYIGVK